LKYPVASAAPVTSTVPFRTSVGMATTLNELVNWKGDPPAAAAPAVVPSSTNIVIVVGAAAMCATKSEAEMRVPKIIFFIFERASRPVETES